MLTGGLPYDADAMVCAGGRDKDACQVGFKNYWILGIIMNMWKMRFLEWHETILLWCGLVLHEDSPA